MTDYTVSRERRRAGDLELELAGFESRERVCVCVCVNKCLSSMLEELLWIIIWLKWIE